MPSLSEIAHRLPRCRRCEILADIVAVKEELQDAKTGEARKEFTACLQDLRADLSSHENHRLGCQALRRM